VTSGLLTTLKCRSSKSSFSFIERCFCQEQLDSTQTQYFQRHLFNVLFINQKRRRRTVRIQAQVGLEIRKYCKKKEPP